MIGVFDSGVGGLSIVKVLQEKSFSDSIIYLADQKYAPYGDKSPEKIRVRAEKITKFLIDKGCEIIVVGCNTATVTTPISHLRVNFPEVSFVGVEPPVKPLSLSSNCVKLLLATEATCCSRYLENKIKDFNVKDLTLIAAKGLADVVENGEDAIPLLKKFLSEYTDKDLKVCVGLGCTHYSFIKDEIHSLIQGSEIIDVSEAVANQVLKMPVNSFSSTNANKTFYTTKENVSLLQTQLKNLLELDLEVEFVDI